jgi:hypothetical protein
MAEIDQKDQIQRSIVRARDGVGDRIDELDRHLRTTLDPKAIARSYAPHLVAGGAIAGVIVGFALPKLFRRLVTWGVPIAIVAVAVKKIRE